MERERRINGRSGGGVGGGSFYQTDPMESIFQPVSSPSSLLSPPRLPISSSDGSVSIGGVSYIEHTVSKMDTLAGVAIKYGVEVADIKRINGLVTDLQMFGLKTLNIPLPGRHPPSPHLSNGCDSQGASCSEHTSPARKHSDFIGSFQSLKLTSSSPQPDVSQAMNTLQGYYGLKSRDQKDGLEECEMAVYRKGIAHYLEDGPFSKPAPLLNPPLSIHRKSKSMANGFLSENNAELIDDSAGENREGEKLVRRRQKSEADFTASRSSGLLMKEDNSSSCGFSSRIGKGLALRPKAQGRQPDADTGWLNAIPLGLGDSFLSDGFNNGVRKSSSTSSLHDQDGGSGGNGSSSLWPTSKWSLKPDLQALSSVAIARPIFDGLPKPITGRRNKTALD